MTEEEGGAVVVPAAVFGCIHGDSAAPHACPYREEIGGDDKTLCTCCKECEYECAEDI